MDVAINTSRLIGFAVYDEEKNKLVEDYWSPVKYAYEASQQKYSQIFDHFNPGVKYWAYPQTTLFGIPILTNNELQFTLGDPYITPEKKEIDYDEAYNFTEMEVITNIANVEFKESDSWISKPTWLPQTPSLLFDCDPLPDNVNIRKGKITAVGRDWDGNIIKEDSITITQMRPILKATPSNLEFERIGGTKQVTIETTYDNLEVKKGADYTYPLPFEMKLNDTKTKLTVTVPENTTGMSRNAAIILTATNKEGKKIQATIFLSQLAEDTNPYYIKFKDSNLELGPGEDTYELTSECNFNWYRAEHNYTYNVIASDKHRWFTFKNVGYQIVDGKCIDKWHLTVEKNDWGFDRDAKIETLAYDKDSTKVAITTIYFTQLANDQSNLDYEMESVEVSFGSNHKETVYNSDGSVAIVYENTPITDSSLYFDLNRGNLKEGEKLEITPKGNSVHIEVLRGKDSDYATLAFDIDKVEALRASKISNISFYGYKQNGSYKKIEEAKFGSIPTDDGDVFYDANDGHKCLDLRYEGYGDQIDLLSYSRNVWNGNYLWKSSSLLKEKCSLSIFVTLKYKGDASARKRAPQEKQTSTTSTERTTRHIER